MRWGEIWTMMSRPDPEPAVPLLDADRIAGLVTLLGIAGFAGLMAQLEAEIDKVLANVRAGADPAAIHGDLHRLQGSSSALGLVETSARLARAAQTGEAAALADAEASFTQAVTELAAMIPEFAAVHSCSRSKR